MVRKKMAVVSLPVMILDDVHAGKALLVFLLSVYYIPVSATVLPMVEWDITLFDEAI